MFSPINALAYKIDETEYHSCLEKNLCIIIIIIMLFGTDFNILTSNYFYVSIKYHKICIFVLLVKPFIAMSISWHI